MTVVLTPDDVERVKRREIDGIREQKAKAEEQWCRNVIEAKGWLVSRVSIRYGHSHFAIVQGDRHWYGKPAELAQRVQADRATYLDATTISETRADRYMGHAPTHALRARYTHSLDGQLALDASALDEYLDGAATGKIVQLAATGTEGR